MTKIRRVFSGDSDRISSLRLGDSFYQDLLLGLTCRIYDRGNITKSVIDNLGDRTYRTDHRDNNKGNENPYSKLVAPSSLTEKVRSPVTI